MNFLYKESESKKNIYIFFFGRGWAGGGGREGARVSKCFTMNQI